MNGESLIIGYKEMVPFVFFYPLFDSNKRNQLYVQSLRKRRIWGDRLIFRYLNPKQWVLVALCGAFIVAQLYFDLRIPEYMNAMTDAILNGSVDNLMRDYGTGMLICAILSLFASMVAGYIAAYVTAELCRELRRRQFEKVQSFSSEDIGDITIASLITRSTSDVYQIQVYMSRGLQIIIKAPILAVWAMLKISGQYWQWTAATAVAVVVIMIVVIFIIERSKVYFKKIQWLTDSINRVTGESIEGVRMVRAYNAEDYQFEKLEKANEDLIKNNLTTMKYTSVMFPFTSAMQNFLTLSIYWIGAILISGTPDYEQQLVLFSDMIVFTSYALMVVSAFLMFSGLIRMLPRATVASQRIQEVIEKSPSIVDGSDTEGEPGHIGDIRLDHVTFTYPGAKRPAIRDVSLDIEKGQTLAIIGPTGSGKSTLVRLLCRLYDPEEGTVCISGKDVKRYQQKDLHNQFGYVPQTSVIFSGTVRYNVNYGRHSAERTDEEIWDALKVAQSDDFVSSMEGGLDANISQHGRNISGGQKQRICIARAVCKDPDIYIFDDSFSALDFRTDRRLRSALRERTKDSTVVIIAQRVGTIMDADKIVVMDNGRIVGTGTHDELMQSCPLYNSIATTQFSEVD